MNTLYISEYIKILGEKLPLNINVVRLSVRYSNKLDVRLFLLRVFAF